MENETPKKPRPVMNGNETGIPYSAERQPSPEAKSAGWKKRRAERLLTQAILSKILGKEAEKGKKKIKGKLEDYVDKLYSLATVDGNAKAIDTINKAIEDDVIKIANTTPDGEPAPAQTVIIYKSLPPMKTEEG